MHQLSLAVPQGVLFGLVGPNGAGKTTALSMATGLLRPDYGSARVLGHDVWADPPAAKALMGVMPDGMRADCAGRGMSTSYEAAMSSPATATPTILRDPELPPHA